MPALQCLEAALVKREEREDSTPMFMAKPTESKVDLGALRDQVMKDFSKTLAYLAK